MKTTDLDAHTVGRIIASAGDSRISDMRNTTMCISGKSGACRGFLSPAAIKTDPAVTRRSALASRAICKALLESRSDAFPEFWCAHCSLN